MTTIKLKNGSGAPTSGDLVQGEPALDLTNKRLYTEDSGGTVIEVGTNPTSITTGDITATGTASFANLATTGNITFGDNDKAVFGAGSDLQIYHSGSHSFISEAGTGDLYIGASSNIALMNSAFSENKLLATTDGALKLYYDGSQKLSTTSTGIDVTGTAVSTTGFQTDATNGYALYTADPSNYNISRSSTEVSIKSGGSISIVTGASQRALFANNGDVSLYEDTGTTAKFFWDASAESLSIGSTLPYAGQTLTVGATAPKIQLDNGAGTLLADFSHDGTTGNTARLYNQRPGSLLFGTNNTERMRIDSSGNVGIGTNSPVFTTGSGLEIQRDGPATLRIEDTGSSGKAFEIYSDDGEGYVVSGIGSGMPMLFKTISTEAMRIDTSQNLLVGTTTTTLTTNAGIHLSSDGFLHASRDGNIAGQFNRITSDGDIVRFRKDGSTVGSIGTVAGRFFIGNDETFLTFKGSTDTIYPASSSGGGRDAAIDLGDSGTRFKDLYLSGTANVGGAYFGTGVEANLIATFAPSTGGNAEFRNTSSTGTFTFTKNNGSSETVRIDSSGNLLVGKTAANFTVAGHEIKPGSFAGFTRDGGSPIVANRLTSDGAIIELYRGATTVGSIGSRLGTGLTIDSGGTTDGLLKNNGAESFGWNADYFYARTDNAKDLGLNVLRWKDLYLSGGVYLGGTAAANKLDDYEEGDHTTSITCTTSGTVTLNTTFDSISYVKVGRLVTVTGLVIVGSVSSPVGAFSISMPFSAASSGVAKRGSDSAAAITVHNGVSANSSDYVSTLVVGSSALTVSLGDNPDVQTDSAQQLQAGTEIYFHISYPTN